MGLKVALALKWQGSSPAVLGPAYFSFPFLRISQKLFAKKLFDHLYIQCHKGAALHICPTTLPQMCYFHQ